jgi:hypothetical protein
MESEVGIKRIVVVGTCGSGKLEKVMLKTPKDMRTWVRQLRIADRRLFL